MVLRLCTVRPLVDNADRLITLSRRLLGDRLTYGVIRGARSARAALATNSS